MGAKNLGNQTAREGRVCGCGKVLFRGRIDTSGDADASSGRAGVKDLSGNLVVKSVSSSLSISGDEVQ